MPSSCGTLRLPDSGARSSQSWPTSIGVEVAGSSVGVSNEPLREFCLIPVWSMTIAHPARSSVPLEPCDGVRHVHEGEQNLLIRQIVVDREISRNPWTSSFGKNNSYVQVPAGARPILISSSRPLLYPCSLEHALALVPLDLRLTFAIPLNVHTTVCPPMVCACPSWPPITFQESISPGVRR